MLKKNRDGLYWLEFELFSKIPELVHGCFLRHGGESIGPCGSLNVSTRRDDDPAAVRANLEKIRGVFSGIPLVGTNQTHSDRVVVVGDHPDIEEGDALITQKRGVALLIKTADCQAAIVYDPIRQVIANIHAGWRGNVQNIYAKTVKRMEEEFGSRPEDLLVGISPSLGPDASEFVNYKNEFPEDFWPFQVKPNHFDLWAIARKQFIDAGVLPENIEIASECTRSNPHDYFSHRHDKATGRQATIIGLAL